MSALAKRDRFTVRVALTPDEVWERLRSHGQVRQSNDPCPSPAPPAGRPFLAARVESGEIRLRHWAGPADATSPVIVLRVDESGRGCVVEGRFTTPSTNGPLVPSIRRSRRRRIALPVVLLAATLGVAYAVLGGTLSLLMVPILAVLFVVPAGLVMFPMLMVWNASSRQIQSEALWALIGELFTPLALPTAERDAPFREQDPLPLPSPSSR